MTDETVPYLPFNAIGGFMRPDYKLDVMRRTLHALPQLPGELRGPIDHMTRLVVKVAGFRNSAKAPTAVKIRPLAEAFEKSPELAGAILSAWAASLPELRQQMADLLTERGWEILPPEADRTQLPGFLTTWPKGEDFETVNLAFKEKYPTSETSEDDVSLMAVWISDSLPYHEVEEEDEGEEEDEAQDTETETDS